MEIIKKQAYFMDFHLSFCLLDHFPCRLLIQHLFWSPGSTVVSGFGSSMQIGGGQDGTRQSISDDWVGFELDVGIK
jgi:hypothetical protein